MRVALLCVAMLVVSGCRTEVSAPPQPVATQPPPTPTALPSATSEPPPTATAPPPPSATPEPTAAPLFPVINAGNIERVTTVLMLSSINGTVYGAAASPDGTLLATASRDGRVRIYDGLTGELLHTLERHRDFVYSVRFSPDGQRLVSGGRDRTVQIWDAATGERIFGMRTSGEVAQLAVSPDGTRFAGAGYYSSVGEMWSMDGASLGLLGEHGTRLRSVAFAQTGTLLATGDSEGVVILHDAFDGSGLGMVEVDGEALTLAFSPAAPVMAVGTSTGSLILWDITTQEEVGRWQAQSGGVLRAAFSPDGALVVTTGNGGAVTVWDAAAGQRLRALNGHSGPVRDVAFSLDGATLITAGDDGRALVWRVEP